MTSKKLNKMSTKIIIILHIKCNLNADNNLKNKLSSNSLRNLFHFKLILINFLGTKQNLIPRLNKYQEAQFREIWSLHLFHYLNNQNKKNKRVLQFNQLNYICNKSSERS